MNDAHDTPWPVAFFTVGFGHARPTRYTRPLRRKGPVSESSQCAFIFLRATPCSGNYFG